MIDRYIGETQSIHKETEIPFEWFCKFLYCQRHCSSTGGRLLLGRHSCEIQTKQSISGEVVGKKKNN